jgi:hypothetical protein
MKTVNETLPGRPSAAGDMLVDLVAERLDVPVVADAVGIGRNARQRC